MSMRLLTVHFWLQNVSNVFGGMFVLLGTCYDWPTEILNQFKEGKTKSWYDFSTYGPAVELPEFSPLLELILFSVASVEKKKTGASCELFLDLKIEF